MKRSFYLTLGACLVGMVALCSNVNAATFTNSGSGQVSITSSGVSGAPSALLFNPSTNVAMAGNSAATAFQANAYHTAVLNKASGQAYGMASNSNKVWFDDISTTSSYSAPTGTTAAAFSGTWVSI